MGDTGDLGYFGPDSVTWRVLTEPASGIGGLRSLLLQALHPLAMAGVADSPGFAEDFWGRLSRTGEYVLTVAFGTTAQADAVAARVRAIHPRVRGVDRVTGLPYRADDPELLRWVHVTEMDSLVSAVARSGAPLSTADVDTFHREQVRAAELIGATDVPTTAAGVADYYERVRPALRSSPLAEEASARLMTAPLPGAFAPLRPAFLALCTLAVATLPGWARRMYGLPGWGVTDVAATAALRALRRGTLPIPRELRLGPVALDGLARAAA